jgi:hypothetical protein
MTSDTSFLLWLFLWVACAGFVLWSQQRPRVGAGLTISYVLQLWVLHWLGAAIYALPWYNAPSVEMSLGLEQSTIAIAGFAIGCGVIVPLFSKKPDDSDITLAFPVDQRQVRTCLFVGIVTYFGLEPVLHPYPTIGAIASSTSNLLLVAIALECWNGLQGTRNMRTSFWRWVLLSAMLPMMTILTKGFLGYGFASMISIFCFVASFYRPRWKIVAWSVVVGYLALSLYVTYMRDRRDIRAVVWGGEAYSSRLSTIGRTFSDFEFLDIQNVDHLARIDDRLNQNYLVGRAVVYLQQNPEKFARGRTLWDAAIAPIPRFLWKEKPVEAGSGDLVSEFTGLRFGGNTTVGIGHVLEWYINFGSVGTFLGMLLLGVLIGWIDRQAASAIYTGDITKFVLWWLPGLSLLQVGGSLVEAVGGGATGLVIGLALRSSLASRAPRQHDDRAVLTAAPYTVAIDPKSPSRS